MFRPWASTPAFGNFLSLAQGTWKAKIGSFWILWAIPTTSRTGFSNWPYEALTTIFMKLSKTFPIPLAAYCQRFLLSVAWLLLGAFCANAQSLVTEISLTTANLTTQEAQAYQTLSQDAFTKNMKLVSFGNPTDFMDNGTITFNLPGLGETIVAKVTHINQSEYGFGLAGRLTNQSGYLAIHENQGLRGAWIQAGQRFFEIMPIKPGVNTLREIKGDIGDVGDCVLTEGPPPPAKAEDFCDDDDNDCSATIDILVLVPQDVRGWLAERFGNNGFIISIFVSLGTYSINSAFINSDIPNKQVNIKIESFNFNYPFALDFGDALVGDPPYLGLNTQAATRRAAIGADLVVLLTRFDFPGGAGAANGNPSDDDDPAFAIVEMPWLINPRWTFVHEVGHLLSARHSRSDPGPGDDDDSDCGHGWTVDGNRFQRTIMAPWFGTATPTDIRVLHFSNPEVDYPLGSGDPTGETDSDNAKSIRNAACSVSNYAVSVFFNAQIVAPVSVCYNLATYINTSSIVNQPTFGNPGVPPYTYEWRWNYTGDFVNDPSYLFGTSATAQLPIPPPMFSSVWIRLRVTSSDNLIVYKYEDVALLGPSDPACDGFQGGGGGGNNLMAPASLSPNPAVDEIVLALQSENEREADILISNSTGSIVYEMKGQHLYEGTTQFRIGLEKLPVGLYTVSIFAESSTESIKFIINR